MKKVFVLLLIIAIAPLIAGVYGIIHDQITYTLSPEYYTKFKFIQFGLMDAESGGHFAYPRIEVAKVGFMATWWMGLPIGIILGLCGLIHQNGKKMFRATIKAFILTIIVAFITGLAGLAYGSFYLAETGVDWWFPDNLIDQHNFIAVGSMHNFSYLGGLTGLLAGFIYQVIQRGKINDDDPDQH